MSDEALELVKREIKPVWQRIDEERRERRELEQAHGETRGQVKVLTQRLDTFVDSFTEHREETRRGHERLFKELQSLRDEIRGSAENHGQQKGRAMAKREMAAWATALAGIISAFAMAAQAL